MVCFFSVNFFLKTNLQPRLVDTLLSAEKHSHAGNQPINPYRKLLVCDLLPLLGMDNVSVELNHKLLFKLLHKAIEFYLYCSGMLPHNSQVMKIISLKILSTSAFLNVGPHTPLAGNLIV